MAMMTEGRRRIDGGGGDFRRSRDGIEATVGISDPNPTAISGPVKNDPNNPPYEPISQGPPIDNGGVEVPPEGAPYTNPSLDELYPAVGTGGISDVAATPGVEFADPIGANVGETDKDALLRGGVVGSEGADPEALERGYAAAAGVGAGRSSNMNVDQDLARIMKQDSPLLQRARAEAAMYSNKRGLLNSSMAAGQNYAAATQAGLTMAQQNSAQRSSQSIANSQNKTQASIAKAQIASQMAQLEAQLGVDVSKFNADQVNRASELTQQLSAAAASQDAVAYNNAQTQLANLMRDAQAQDTELDYRAGESTAAAENQRNTQLIDSVTQLNQQYLNNMGAADIANIQGTYNQLISTNQAAASVNESMMAGLAQIMDDPTMTPQQVATAVAALQKQSEASLRMIQEMNDLDFTVPGSTPAPNTSGPGPRGRRGNR